VHYNKLIVIMQLDVRWLTGWSVCGYNGCNQGVAQSGSAPALGAGGRRFESCCPDQFSAVAQW